MGAAYTAPIEDDLRVSCYEHSSAAGAGIRWFSDPGGRKKVE
jgi:hypothetical protein